MEIESGVESIPEDQVETIQRVQFALRSSYDNTSFYRPTSLKFGLRDIENFLNVAQAAGLAIEAWMRSNKKEWDEHLDFTSVVDNISMDIVVAYGESLLRDPENPEQSDKELKELVNKSMAQELRTAQEGINNVG
jgi:hypothetical protein